MVWIPRFFVICICGKIFPNSRSPSKGLSATICRLNGEECMATQQMFVPPQSRERRGSGALDPDTQQQVAELNLRGLTLTVQLDAAGVSRVCWRMPARRAAAGGAPAGARRCHPPWPRRAPVPASGELRQVLFDLRCSTSWVPTGCPGCGWRAPRWPRRPICCSNWHLARCWPRPWPGSSVHLGRRSGGAPQSGSLVRCPFLGGRRAGLRACCCTTPAIC